MVVISLITFEYLVRFRCWPGDDRESVCGMTDHWRVTRTRTLLLVEIPAPPHHGRPGGQEATAEDGGESLGAERQRGADR